MEKLELLVSKLIKYDSETSWFEFKHNNYNPEMIGEDISALANSAALEGKSCAYMIWGIHDKTHEILGTEYDQYTLKKGEQEIESWLRNLLSGNVDFSFNTIYIDDQNNVEKKVVVLTIHRPYNQTVTFKKVDYIRVGSYTKKLNEYPQLRLKLWDRLRSSDFESQVAKIDMSLDDVLKTLDFSVYFELIDLPMPKNIKEWARYMMEESVINFQDNGLYSITNLGAILFAKNLSDFDRLKRRSLRVVQYEGNNRVGALSDYVEYRGYALSFVSLLKKVEELLPFEKISEDGLRLKQYSYPLIALREVIANALIHQEFIYTGTGVLIEIFLNRIEITNPGTPLVDTLRIVDNPPKSRNEKLAFLMRRLGMCEELGTGWDKIIISCEKEHLPAPRIDIYDENTKVTLLSKIDFFDMSLDNKLWTCYMHACIKYIQGEFLTNSSLRERFGLEEKSSASVSRLIKEACNQGRIKKHQDTAPKHTKYIPNWA